MLTRSTLPSFASVQPANTNRLWTGLHIDDLGALAGAAKVLNSRNHVEWLPQFGCAIVALEQLPPKAAGIISTAPESPEHCPQLSLGSSSLLVVGLDGFQFHSHRCGDRFRRKDSHLVALCVPLGALSAEISLWISTSDQ
eukprot:1161380-Pelagomonas_calceolata.AAC.12